MTMVYHGTPIPLPAMAALGRRAFCVSFEPRSRRSAPHVEAQAVALMYDNGEFARFTAARRSGAIEADTLDRSDLYRWLEVRLFHPGRWAVIPDVIDGEVDLQDRLLALWPFGHKGVPVWHTNEPLDRLHRLLDEWPRVCFGSSGEHWLVGGRPWTERMDLTWSALEKRRVRPVVHMLRGVGVAHLYPFDSADSTGFAQSMHRYRQPLFAGTPDEWTGIVAFADRLEKRAAGGLQPRQHRRNDLGRGRLARRPGPVTLVEGAPVHDLPFSFPGCNQ